MRMRYATQVQWYWHEWRQYRGAFRQQQRPTTAVAAVLHHWLQLRLFVIRSCSCGCSISAAAWRAFWLQWRLFVIRNYWHIRKSWG